MPRFAANLTMMFTEHAFLDRFDAAAAAGFRGVEFLFPYAEDPRRIRAALDRTGLAPALFNTPPGDWHAGERGMAAVPGQGAAFRDSIARAMDHAAVIRPARIHIMAGLANGAEAEAAYVENLSWATAHAPDQTFVIEPINARDMPGYFLSTSTQALRVLDAVAAPNLMLQFDLYHAQIMEGDLTRRIAALAPRIGHVQIAGVPDRHEPSSGELNYPALFDALDGAGYQGWIGCEYRPAGRTEDGLAWLDPYRPQ